VTFQASSHLVTHQEFDGFVADGGYRERSLWTDDGWEWRRVVGAERPRFIDANGGLRALFDHMPRPAAWPVEVNAHEAAAFCAWIGDGARLPTEAEWALLAARSPRRLSEGGGLRTDLDNLALRWGSPSSVEACPEGAVEPGIHDVFGNVWEWLSDEFSPLPGFRSHRLYEDFSAPYFGTEHGMMAGGSWATTGAGASPWYRLWFRRHFYQHAGFRPVRSVTRSTSPSIGD
jgi:formylglycine-generating enzyme required for sulfatase activity